MSYRNIFSAFFMIILLLSCQGQSEKDDKRLGHKVLAINQNIWTAFQDSRGNYWFGSNGNVLFRYDGRELVQFTTEDGLIDNTIRSVRENRSGSLFIETPKGVSKYNGESFRRVPRYFDL
jgi:ligand-binding sensor domain-containing protein